MPQKPATATPTQSLAPTPFRRRTVVQTAVWAGPIVTLATAAPAFARSTVPACDNAIDIEGVRTASGAVVQASLLTVPAIASATQGILSYADGSASKTQDLATFVTQTLLVGGLIPAAERKTATLTFAGEYGSYSATLANWNVANADWSLPALTVRRRVEFTRVYTPSTVPGLGTNNSFFTLGYRIVEDWKWVHTTVDAVVTNPGCDPITDLDVGVFIPLDAGADFNNANNFVVEVRPSTTHFTFEGTGNAIEVGLNGVLEVGALGRGVSFSYDVPNVTPDLLYPNSGTTTPHTVPLQFTISKIYTYAPAVTPLDVGTGLLSALLNVVGDLVAVIPLDLLDIQLGSGAVLAPWSIARGTATDGTTAENVSDIERLGYIDLFSSPGTIPAPVTPAP